MPHTHDHKSSKFTLAAGTILYMWVAAAIMCVLDSPGYFPPDSVHTTMAIFPAKDVPEMNFFLDVANLLGPGNYYRHTVLVLVTPKKQGVNMRCTGDPHSPGCQVQAVVDSLATKVTTGVVYDTGALYVDQKTVAATDFTNTSVLVNVDYTTHDEAQTVQLVRTMEREFNAINSTTSTVIHHEAKVIAEVGGGGGAFDWETPATGVVGIAILAWAIRSPRSTAITVLNIALVYLVAFRAVGALTDTSPVLAFGPNLMLAIIVAFCIDYSLFLVKPYTIAARDGTLNNQDDVMRVLKDNWQVIGISCTVLCACFLSLLVVTDVQALSSLAYSCIITVVLTAAANLTVTPSLLCFGLGRRLLMPQKRARYIPLKGRDSFVTRALFPAEAAHATKTSVASAASAASAESTARTLRWAILFLYVAITAVATCWVYGVYDAQAAVSDAGSVDALLAKDAPYARAMQQVAAQYGAGTTSPGQVLIQGDNTNATIHCLTTMTNSTRVTLVAQSHNVTLHKLTPPTSFPHASGRQWYEHTLPDAKQACARAGAPHHTANAAAIIQTYFEDQLSLDAIADIWPKFEDIIIPMLLVLCALTVYIAFRSKLLALYAAFSVVSVFSVALALLRAVYPTAHSNIYQYPLPGQEPLAFVWFVPIMVVPVVVGIKLDYVTLRLHEYHHHPDRSTPDKVRQAVHDATVSISPTIMYAGLIMVVAFSGLYAQEAPTAHQIATMLVASLIWITWINEVLVQPVLKYESAKWLVHKEEPAASSKQGNYHRLQASLEDERGQAPGLRFAVMGKEPASTGATAAAALRPGQRKWGFR